MSTSVLRRLEHCPLQGMSWHGARGCRHPEGRKVQCGELGGATCPLLMSTFHLRLSDELKSKCEPDTCIEEIVEES